MLKKPIIIILIIAAAGFLYWWSLNSPFDPNGTERLFTVNKGETVKQVAAGLEKEGLIKSAFYFKYRVWRQKQSVKAGEYLIGPKLTTGEIIRILSAGEVVGRERTIRIIEGWNLKEIGAYLEKNSAVTAKSFVALTGAPLSGWKFAFIKPSFLADAPKTASLEGYLFPDTYKIFKDAAAEEIIFKLLDNFDKKLTAEMRREIKRQKKTVYEIATMASLIEKEVRSEADMKIVSGIFWERLANRVALNSCATLAYILGVNKPQYSLDDTKIESPYNTYKYRGLPPGPIANPGLNAVKAAIYPTPTAYNYFLSDPATGQTIYSKTLEEHNANKAKYLK